MRLLLLKNPRLMAAVVIVAVILAVALWPSAMRNRRGRVERGPMQVTIDEEGETRVRERFVVSAPVMGRVRAHRARAWRSRRARQDRRGPPDAGRLAAHRSAAAGGARRRGRGRASPPSDRRNAERERAAAALTARNRPCAGESLAEGRCHLGRRARSRADDVEDRGGGGARRRVRGGEGRARARSSRGARLKPSSRRRPDRRRHRASRRRRAEAAARERVGRARRRAPPRDWRSAKPRDRLGPALDRRRRVSSRRRRVIEQWGGSQPLEGRVRRVEPSGFMKVSALGVEEQRVNVIVDFADEAAPRPELGDGYRVEVRIVIWQRRRGAQGAGRQPLSPRRRLGRVRRSSTPGPRAANRVSSVSVTIEKARS